VREMVSILVFFEMMVGAGLVVKARDKELLALVADVGLRTKNAQSWLGALHTHSYIKMRKRNA